MKTSSSISVTSDIDIPFTAIEKYVNTNLSRPSIKGTSNQESESISQFFENIDCCCVYVPINGTVEITLTNENSASYKSAKIEVATSYLFTCTKGSDRQYKLAWGTSLS